MQTEPPKSAEAAGPARAEDLMQEFQLACTKGDSQTAANVLRQLDELWLGVAMSFREREQALRILRRLREQLDNSRKRGLFNWH